MARAKPYMVSRQVQNEPLFGPERSARPIMARWWAWEWTLGTAGMAAPAILATAVSSLFAVTAVIRPAASTSTATSLAQPPGRSAVSNLSLRMDMDHITLYRQPCTSEILGAPMAIGPSTLIRGATLATMAGSGPYVRIEDGAVLI